MRHVPCQQWGSESRPDSADPTSFFFLFFRFLVCGHTSPRAKREEWNTQWPLLPQLKVYMSYIIIFFCHKQNFPNVAAFLCVLTCADPADENKNIRASCRLVLRAWRSIWRGTWLVGKPNNTNTHKAWGLLLQLRRCEKELLRGKNHHSYQSSICDPQSVTCDVSFKILQWAKSAKVIFTNTFWHSAFCP